MLYRSELRKMAPLKTVLLFCSLLLAFLCFLAFQNQTAAPGFDQPVYEWYMNRLEGELTPEKEQFLREEQSLIADTLSREGAMRQDFLDEKITREEYSSYCLALNYAKIHAAPLQLVMERYEYIRNFEAEVPEIHPVFLNDIYWNRLLDCSPSSFNPFLLLFLSAAVTPIVYSERRNGVFPVLYASANGRGKTIQIKILAGVTLSSSASLIFSAAEYALLSFAYSLPLSSAPLQSLPSFSAVPGAVSLGGYYWILCVWRVLASVLFCLLFLAVSSFARSLVSGLLLELCLLGVPLLFFSAAGRIRIFSPSSLANGSPLFSSYYLWGGFPSWAAAVLLMSAVCALCIRLIFLGYHRVHHKR